MALREKDLANVTALVKAGLVDFDVPPQRQPLRRRTTALDLAPVSLRAPQLLARPRGGDGSTISDRTRCRETGSPFWVHVNPYGRFRLDMDARLDLTTA